MRRASIWYFLFCLITVLCVTNTTEVNGEKEENSAQNSVDNSGQKNVPAENKDSVSENIKNSKKESPSSSGKQPVEDKKEKKNAKGREQGRSGLSSLAEEETSEQKENPQNVEHINVKKQKKQISEKEKVKHTETIETVKNVEKNNMKELEQKEQEQATEEEREIHEEVYPKKQHQEEEIFTKTNEDEGHEEFGDELEYVDSKNFLDDLDDNNEDANSSIYNNIRDLKSKHTEKHMKPDAEDFHYDNETAVEDITSLWNKSMQNFEPSTLLTFEIGSNSEEFLFEDVDKIDTYFRGVFYSYNDMEDNIIQFLIQDPDGNVIYKKEASEGIFLFHTKKIGVYTFALRNTKWVGKKVIAVAIGIGENPSLQSDHVKDFTNYLHQIIAETIKLNNEIKYLTSKHHVHIEKMKKIANKALTYHCIKLFVLIFLSGFTIYYIKNLVQNKRVL